MDDVVRLSSTDPPAALDRLRAFSQQNAAATSFVQVCGADVKRKFVERGVELLSLALQADPTLDALWRSPAARRSWLEALRIASREKISIEALHCEAGIALLMRCAALVPGGSAPPAVTGDADEAAVQLEALRCLYNAVFQNPPNLEIFHAMRGTEQLVARVRSLPTPMERATCAFVLRLLFVVTAVHEPARDAFVAAGGTVAVADRMAACLRSRGSQPPLSREDIGIVADGLRLLFNVSVPSAGMLDADGGHARSHSTFEPLVGLLRAIVVGDHAPIDQPELLLDVRRSAIHLLTNIPSDMAFAFVMGDDARPPSTAEGDVTVRRAAEEAKARPVADGILAIYASLLDDQRRTNAPQSEAFAPIVVVMRNFARNCPPMRRILARELLPHRSRAQVGVRPEQGETLAARTVALMTSPSHDIQRMSAELMLVLCKENMARVVRATGYGNAAGLLASRGLFGGSLVDHHGPAYSSSDSEDVSDEEGDGDGDGPSVNPITGALEDRVASANIQDAFAGMTEEEKEAEAERLSMLFDRLNQHGLIRAVPVGPDGRPVENHPGFAAPAAPRQSDSNTPPPR